MTPRQNTFAAIAAASALAGSAQAQPTLVIEGNVQNQSSKFNYGDDFKMSITFNDFGQSDFFDADPNQSVQFFPTLSYVFESGAHKIQGTHATQMGINNDSTWFEHNGVDIFYLLWNLDEIAADNNGVKFMELQILGNSGYLDNDNIAGNITNVGDRFLSNAENYLRAPGENYQSLFMEFADNTDVWCNVNNVTYVPAPGAATLLGLAGLAGARRRRSPSPKLEV